MEDLLKECLYKCRLKNTFKEMDNTPECIEIRNRLEKIIEKIMDGVQDDNIKKLYFTLDETINELGCYIGEYLYFKGVDDVRSVMFPYHKNK